MFKLGNDEQGAFPMPSPVLQRGIIGLTFLIILVVSLLAIVSIRQLITTDKQMQSTQALLVEINAFLSDLKDVEMGARGYVISGGDELNLRRQHQGIAAVNASANRLRVLAADKPSLSRSLDILLPLVSQRIHASQQLIKQRRDLQATKHNLLVGGILMLQIRDKTEAMLRTEQHQFLEEGQRLERQAWISSLALAAGNLFCLSVIAWLFSIRGREIARRREVETEFRALNLELEDRVLERAAEIKRARDLLYDVIEGLPDMVALKKRSGDGFRYVLINSAGERLLGRDKSEILGRTDYDLFPPEEAIALLAEDNKITESGLAPSHATHNLATNHGVRAVETRRIGIANENGSPTLLVVIIRDITDAKLRDQQFQQIQRIDAVGQLTGGVAHDFNNILAVIMGSVELVHERLPVGSEAATIANEALDAARRGADLVRRLLAFARKQNLEPAAIDLNERLLNITSLLQRTLGGNIRIRVKSGKELWRARIDPTQAEDAIMNLAINARDAMPEGGVLTIETANVVLDEDYASHYIEVEPGEYVMLAISDSGTGMPPNVAERAFEPFFTTKPEGQGTGLGLSQVFGWVKQSGGHIKIYSELGHGTTVKLYLPRSTDDSELAQEQEIHADDARGHETIFIVEDNPNVRRTLKRQLADLGYAIIEAEDAESALKKIEFGVQFDLLLTDIVMPGGMSGYELAAQLETLRPGTKVLFMSGYTKLAATGLQTSRDGPLISKPYTKLELGRALRSELDDVKHSTT